MRMQRRTRAVSLRFCVLFCALVLIATCASCGRLTRYTLVSEEYGFAVTFPVKPIKTSDKNYQGFPKVLWTVYRDNPTDFYSAQATSYKEPLPTEGWVPGKEVGELAGIRLMEGTRFKLRSAESGREAVAVATTSLAPSGGIIATTYIIDGTKLISVTARTENERDRAAFLQSLKLVR